MQTTIEQLLPVFGYIVCGYGAAKVRLIREGGVDGLMSFVLYFAVPALLFRIAAGGNFPALDNLAIVLAYYGGCFLVFATAVLLGWLMFSLPLEQRAILGMGSMYSNSVLLALPLVFTTFGEAGLVPLLPIIALHNILLFPVVIVFIEIGRGRRQAADCSPGTVMISTLRGTLENPVIIALIVGFVWAAAGLGMPAPLDAFTGALAKAVAPAALFALGASMAGYRLGGQLSESATMVLFKLILHPAVVWLLGRYVFDLEPLYLAVATIAAAAPVGANVFVLAHRYQVYLARVTSALMISVVLSVVTLTVVLTIFMPG